MGCPTECELGDTLTFSVCTHDPDTGVLTDAGAVPDYWIYEDETGISINANTPNADVMAKLDDAHTTGFYSELITCSTGNGYEEGKTYTVYIEATVDGDKGGISYAFKIVKARVDYDALVTLVNNIPTTAEFESRTLLAAAYTVVADLGVVQTGDSFAIIDGAHGNVSIQDDIDTLLARITAALPTLAQMNAAHALLATPAQVNAQALDVLNVDTYPEPGQAAPPATASIATKINYLYKQWRNKKDNDGVTRQLYNDAGAVVDQKSDVAEALGTVTIDEMASGP